MLLTEGSLFLSGNLYFLICLRYVYIWHYMYLIHCLDQDEINKFYHVKLLITLAALNYRCKSQISHLWSVLKNTFKPICYVHYVLHLNKVWIGNVIHVFQGYFISLFKPHIFDFLLWHVHCSSTYAINFLIQVHIYMEAISHLIWECPAITPNFKDLEHVISYMRTIFFTCL